jgi:hypothetical protein
MDGHVVGEFLLDNLKERENLKNPGQDGTTIKKYGT